MKQVSNLGNQHNNAPHQAQNSNNPTTLSLVTGAKNQIRLGGGGVGGRVGVGGGTPNRFWGVGGAPQRLFMKGDGLSYLFFSDLHCLTVV